MKKAIYISGTSAVLLLILLLTGWASADETVKESMRLGNREFEAYDYGKALTAYETGLSADNENQSLNFNAAQAAYLNGDYDKAMEYFEKSGDSVEKFLTAGNICYRTGYGVQDINQKAEFYAQALHFYMGGIVKYPQNISLKYNYEFVNEKLEELLENMEQENGEKGDEGEDSGESGGQERESETSENSQDNREQESEQNEETEDTQSQSQEGDEEQEEEKEEGYSQDEEENAADRESVERILQMLENQEEQSLKNNQEVLSGNDDKNGW